MTSVVVASRKREQRGWYYYDWANSAFPTIVMTVFLGPYLTEIAENAADPRGYVDVLGFDVRYKAYFTLIVSLAAALQILVMPFAGALADHTGRKKELLAAFAYVGAFATLGMYFISGDRYVLGGVLFTIAQVAFGASIVVYNSFLPEIATADELDMVSSRGAALGYLGGGLLLAMNLVLFLQHDTFGVAEGTAVRIALASAGIWWGIFTVIPLLRLRNRHPVVIREKAVTDSVRQLRRTIRDLRFYPRTLLFLLAYLVYNDGMQTVINFSATYADHELELSQSVRIGAILMVQFVAVGGALLLGRLARNHGAKHVVQVSLFAWAGVVGAAYFMPPGAVLGFFGLAFVIAIVMGGTQALSRSMFAQVIPSGREAEYYSLYELSDRGATLLGSLTITAALQLTDSYRIAIISLLVFFAAGFVLLRALDLPRAIREAGNTVPKRV